MEIGRLDVGGDRMFRDRVLFDGSYDDPLGAAVTAAVLVSAVNWTQLY